jgi:hypothetical protein
VIPQPVLDALIAAGTLGRDGIGRSAQLRTCPHCRQWTIVGDDHFRCALRVTCDPIALDPIGEALALLAGRHTYDVWGRELNRRTALHIKGGQSQTVIADHDCGNAATPSPDVLALFLPSTLAVVPEEVSF